MVKVLAKQVLFDPLFQILVRGGDDAHVGGDWRVAADAVILAIRQHTQQSRLQILWHVADLIQEQRAFLGLFETATAHRGCTGKRAALMAEQFALQQILRDRRRIDRDEGIRRARAMPVQRPRDQLLAGARFAVDEYRGMRLRQTADGAKHLLHCRRGAKNVRCSRGGFFDRNGTHRFIQRATNQFDRTIDIEGLR